MLQKASPFGPRDTDDIPFGVRAIERGVFVEGIHISRPTTPDSARRIDASGAQNGLPRNDASHDLEAQSTPSRSIYGAARSTKTTSSSFDRAVSAERLPSSHNSRESLPMTTADKPSKGRCPPPSLTKYTGNPSLYRNSSSLTTLQGIEAIHRASTSLQPDSHFDAGSGESYKTSSESNDSDPISAAAPELLSQRMHVAPAPARVRDSSADFALLEDRRMSQVAETGQLVPSAQKPTRNANRAMHGPAGPTPQTIEQRRQHPNDPTHAQASASGSPSTSSPSLIKFDAIPAAIRRSSMPEGVTPFTQFVQTAPQSPPPAKLKAAHHDAQQQLPSRRTRDSARSRSPTRLAEVHTAQSYTGPDRQSFEKDRPQSQVVRGAGSGFEVLKPGSLHPAMPTSQTKSGQRTAPPLSLDNYKNTRSRSRSSSTGSSRKLQKKRRTSVDSHNSAGSGK
jgi:hypothetical protein